MLPYPGHCADPFSGIPVTRGRQGNQTNRGEASRDPPEHWVWVECPRGRIARESLEALTAGLELARALKTPPVAVWSGAEPAPSQIEFLSALGLKKVLLLLAGGQNAPLDPASLQSEACLLHQFAGLLQRRKPSHVLFGATPLAAALAPRLAARAEIGLALGITHLRRVGETLHLTRPVLNNRVSEVLCFAEAACGLVSIAPRCFSLPVPSRSAGEARLEIERFPAEGGPQCSAAAEILGREEERAATLDLEDAEVVVAGGRGLGSREAFSLLEELAGLLGGAVAASRLAVDLGWAGKERLVGQTGRKIAPELYIACGISGAPQHQAGMKESRAILAVNIDPLAPIFRTATWGVVGDAVQVVRGMIAVLREERL